MSTEVKINYWIDLSSYDLDTAKSMLKSKRYLYVGFMCHQAVEKILKAYHWFITKKEPPYTHNLIILCELVNVSPILTKEQNKLINTLMPLNIQARYPDNKDLLLKSLNHKKCSDIINQTEVFYKWIKELIKK